MIVEAASNSQGSQVVEELCEKRLDETSRHVTGGGRLFLGENTYQNRVPSDLLLSPQDWGLH